MGKIIIVGGSWVIAKYIAFAASLLGYEPVFLGDTQHYSAQVRESLETMEHYNADINSVEDMLRVIKENNIENIVAVTTTQDDKLKNSILLADKLGVKGPDKSILVIGDKNEVATLMPEYSPQTLHFDVDHIPYADLEKMLDKFKLVVVKPTRGSGAVGVEKLYSKQDLSSLEARLKKFKKKSWIAQQGVTGELFSVEGYCKDGKVRILGFSLRDRFKATEMSSHFPANDIFKPEIRGQAIEAINVLAKRAGFKYGYFHCEFLTDGNQTLLIDANFGRLGGAALIEQLATSFGHTPEQITAHIMNICMFGKDLPGVQLFTKAPSDSISLAFGVDRAITLDRVELPANVKTHSTLVAAKGQRIEPVGTDDDAWIGFFGGKEADVLEDLRGVKIYSDEGEVPVKIFLRHTFPASIQPANDNQKQLAEVS